jgi:hypothetical protein
MTKTIFLRNVAILFACLAVVMITACNGGGNKKTAEDAAKDALGELSKEAKKEFEKREVKSAAEWVDNELTKQVPKPTGTITKVTTRNDDDGSLGMITIVMDWTEEQAKNYAASLKDDGFKRVIYEKTEGTEYQFYAAKDIDGDNKYIVNLRYDSETGKSSFWISK